MPMMINIRFIFLLLITLSTIPTKIWAAPSDHYASVQEIYIAYYGRPADPAGLQYWAERLDTTNGSLDEIITQFGYSDEYTDRFGSESNSQLINNIYQNLFNRNSDDAGLIFYEFLLETGLSSLPEIALDILNGATGSDALIRYNKRYVSEYFTTELERLNKESHYTSDLVPQLTGILSNVDSSMETQNDFDEFKSQIDNLLSGLDNNQTEEEIKRGVFIDSLVEGLCYKTSSGLEGKTNQLGEYSYRQGDKVTFCINNLTLGEVEAKDLVSVFDLESHDKVALLLQSIDTDGNPGNGINISDETYSKFNTPHFSIQEIDPSNSNFQEKYNEALGYNMEVFEEHAHEHALLSLKLSHVEEIAPNLLKYIRNPDFYNIPNYDSLGINPKEHLKSISSRMRAYIFYEHILGLLTTDIDTINSIITNRDHINQHVGEKIDKTSKLFAKFFALTGILSSGYKNASELLRIRNSFSTTTGYVNDALFWGQFTDLAAQQTIDESLKIMGSYASQDEIAKEAMADCIGAFNASGFLQCMSNLLGRLGQSTNSLYYNTENLFDERRRLALVVTKSYLQLYNILDAANNPHVMAETLTQIAKSELSPTDALKYAFPVFDPKNDEHLEKALDLLYLTNIGQSTWAYNFNAAKESINNYQQLIDSLAFSVSNQVDSNFLIDLDNQYLDVDVTLTPDQNGLAYCVNVDNISSVTLKSVTARLEFYVDGEKVDTEVLTFGDIITYDTFRQHCTNSVDLTTNYLLSRGLLEVKYELNYLPSIFGEAAIRSQYGSDFFEVDYDNILSLSLPPAISVDAPLIVTEGESITFDASATSPLNTNDSYNFQWDYLSSSKAAVSVGNYFSPILNFTAPPVTDGKDRMILKFKLTVRSTLQPGLNSEKYVYLVVSKSSPIEPDIDDETTPPDSNNTSYPPELLYGATLNESDKWQAQITFESSISWDTISATIDFRTLSCGGYLITRSAGDGGYYFDETITYGNCVQNCTIWIQANGASYKEFCNGVITGSGTLTGAPPWPSNRQQQK